MTFMATALDPNEAARLHLASMAEAATSIGVGVRRLQRTGVTAPAQTNEEIT
jgi:hypothetical protein